MESILLFCAHRWEANPFLEHLEMHPVIESPFPFSEFRQPDGEYSLFLTGQGSERAAAVVASVLSRSPKTDSQIVANFGTSGSHKESFEVGKTVLINRSVAEASGRSFYPDRLVRSNWPETTCRTLARPGRKMSPPLAKEVYDMELSGILSACELYLHSCQVVAGKIVSDHVSDDPPDWREMVDAITEPYRAACLDFLKHLDAHRELLAENPRNLRADLAGQLVNRALKEAQGYFTVTQCRQLESALRARALSCLDYETWSTTAEEIERRISGRERSTKSQRSLLFGQLLRSLSTPTIFSAKEES